MLPLGMTMGLWPVRGPGPLALLTAAITTAGNVLLTFNRPVTSVIGTAADIELSHGDYASLTPSAIGSPSGNTVTLTFNPPIYSDYTDPLLNMLSNVFDDSDGNVLPAVVDLPLTNSSTVRYRPPNTFVAHKMRDDFNAGRVWQNAGKTVPATADSDPVRVVTDSLGNDLTFDSDAILKISGGSVWLEITDPTTATCVPATLPAGGTLTVASAFDGTGLPSGHEGRWFSLNDGNTKPDYTDATVAAAIVQYDGPSRLGTYRNAFLNVNSYTLGKATVISRFSGTEHTLEIAGTEYGPAASTGTFAGTQIQIASNGLAAAANDEVTGKWWGHIASTEALDEEAMNRTRDEMNTL